MVRSALMSFVLLSSAIGLGRAASAAPVYVADGDCAALQAAVASGTAASPASIVLARNGHYASCGVDAAGAAKIDGSGATWTPACIARSIVVKSGARLSLRDVTLSAAQCGRDVPIEFVDNSGSLELESVAIDPQSVFNRGVINEKGASLTLRNVTGAGGLANSGTLTILNSTWTTSNITAQAGAQVVVANSIVTSGGSVCPISGAGSVRSLGGNVLDHACTWRITSDSVSSDVGLAKAAVDNGGLVHTLALTSDSIARTRGVAAYCPATDARGVTRAVGACDAGAYEFNGGRRTVSDGGANGLYFDQAADGHYVTLQRLSDELVLVFWNTFDRNGNPAWIYGVGSLDGRHIHADMSQNVGGRLQAGGPAKGSHPRSWGTVEIDLADCLNAQFQYASPLAEFGSGQFSLDRLAELYDFGCAD